MHKPESLLENIKYKTLRDKFGCFSKSRIKNKTTRKTGQKLDLCLRVKEVMEHESNCDTNPSWTVGIVPKNLEKSLSELDIQGRI